MTEVEFECSFLSLYSAEILVSPHFLNTFNLRNWSWLRSNKFWLLLYHLTFISLMSVKRALRSSMKVLTETSKGQAAGSGDHSAAGIEVLKDISDKPVRSKAEKRSIFTPPCEELPAPARKKARLPSPGLLPEANLRISAAQSSNQPPVSLHRPAEPRRTNAPLRTPRGSRLLTYSKEFAESSPSRSGIPRPLTTIANLLEQACDHLIQLDPRFEPLIEKHPCPIFSPEGLAEEIDPFQSLCSGIISQQVSGAAAKSIKNKFTALFQPQSIEEASQAPIRFPQPAEVAASELPRLRQAGLSQRKAEYIKGLAKKFADGELSAETLINASDEEVLERLTAVRGLGKWSVEMFACFSLKRMDVLSTGDLGVQYSFSLWLWDTNTN